ncbi:MAG: ribosome small subunit-dependent GTPase A [Clostridia bacterium]|nr:ribosome small subunit-dependent GTPase A [Clostridia bacterium]
MEKKVLGRVIKGVGGLYTVLVDRDGGELAGKAVQSRARGVLRRGGREVLAGDVVTLSYDAERYDGTHSGDEASFVIEEIGERKNSLIRPPLSNLDYLFITVAAASPAPVLLTVDKLFSICVYNDIEPIALISKSELNESVASEVAEIYKKAGFETFLTSAETGEGIDALAAYIDKLPAGSVSAFSGASGVGKSTLLNKLFPHLELSTSSVSRKTERGRHTTRQTELFVIREGSENGETPVFLADTPGFTMLDFDQFDFFSLEDLPMTMREFESYIGCCKYKKCTHTKEEGCSILEAVASGEISPSRHKSYLALYETLKAKKKW